MDLSVRVININTEKKHPILKKCDILREYSEFVAKFVAIFTEYAVQYPKSEWVRNVLQQYTVLLENCEGLTIDAQQAEIVIQSNKDFWVVLRDNPELTTAQLVAGDYKIPAEWR